MCRVWYRLFIQLLLANSLPGAHQLHSEDMGRSLLPTKKGSRKRIPSNGIETVLLAAPNRLRLKWVLVLEMNIKGIFLKEIKSSVLSDDLSASRALRV